MNAAKVGRLIVSAGVMLAAIAQTRAAEAFWYWHVPSSSLGDDKLIRQSVENYAYAPQTPSSNDTTLVLFLAGTGGEPDDYTNFLHTVASRGYYVLGLDYANFNHEYSLCGCEADCYGDLWEQEVVKNGGYNGFLVDKFFDEQPSVDPSAMASHNAIGNRIVLMLKHLQAHPIAGSSANWGQFLNADQSQAVWSKVIVAGHSKGSDIATWMLLNKGTKAALAFTGVNNYTGTGPAETCDTPAAYRKAGVWCSLYDVGTSTCTPHDEVPEWEPEPRSSPYPNLYLLDSIYDGYFVGDKGNQVANAIDFGWTRPGTGGSKDYQLFDACPSTFTSNWFVDTNPASGHSTTAMDIAGETPAQLARRQCIWNRMLSLPHFP